MITYVDSSVMLRLVFEEPESLAEWSFIQVGVSSVLARIECLRTLQRHRMLRPKKRVSIHTAERSAALLLANVTMLRLSDEILERAAHAIDVPLGTLDALHLATALHYRATSAETIYFATHDRELATAARAFGFPTLG